MGQAVEALVFDVEQSRLITDSGVQFRFLDRQTLSIKLDFTTLLGDFREREKIFSDIDAL